MSAHSGPADWWTDGTDAGRAHIATKGIVQSGLVLNLDAGVSASYPGSGTTWTDLSGNGRNATLTNGPTFSSNNGGAVVFDGTNDHALLPTNFFSYPSLLTYSCSIWFLSTQTNGGTLFGQQATNNPASTPGGYVPVIYLRSDGFIRCEPFWTGGISNFILSTSALNNNIWHNVTFTFNSGTHRLYIDGNYANQRTGLSQTSYTSTYYYILGAGFSDGRSLGSHYFNGKLSSFCFYNKTLSDAEISKNFNALRGRYGI